MGARGISPTGKWSLPSTWSRMKASLRRGASAGLTVGSSPCIDWHTVGVVNPPVPKTTMFSLYPNPYAGGLLTASMEFPKTAQVLVFSTDGGMTVRTSFNGHELNLPSHLPNGAYTVAVFTPQMVYTSKLVVQR